MISTQWSTKSALCTERGGLHIDKKVVNVQPIIFPAYLKYCLLTLSHIHDFSGNEPLRQLNRNLLGYQVAFCVDDFVDLNTLCHVGDGMHACVYYCCAGSPWACGDVVRAQAGDRWR